MNTIKEKSMLKKIVLSGCIGVSSLLYAKVNVVVSILPQQTFIEKIGGDKVHVTTMVKPGSDPHSYEPKASQMVAISKADIYFPIEIEFENAWLEKFKQQNSQMQFVKMTKGISFLQMPEHTSAQSESHGHHHNHHHHHHHDHHHGGVDPHTWTSPSNVKIMAKNIYDTLVKVDAKNSIYYKKNYEKFLEEIAHTDAKIKEIFTSVPKGSKFMVLHPSWGYFANAYGLVQLPVEINGKEPKPKVLRNIIDIAQKENIKAIFTQQEFSDKSANAIARELNIKVIKETPLAKEWSQNLIKKAQAIANQH
jgi:zinc transport system substrate-binding protein